MPRFLPEVDHLCQVTKKAAGKRPFMPRGMPLLALLQQLEAELALLVDAVGVGAVLGDGDAAGVEEGDALGGLGQLLYVGVAVKERGAGRQRREQVGVPQVPVGEPEGAAGLVDELGVVAHARKIQHHLVHLGLAVAAHAGDGGGQTVEHGDDLLGSIAARQVVAGAVVEEIAQEDDLVGLLGVDSLHKALAPIGRSMDVASNEILHKKSYLSRGPLARRQDRACSSESARVAASLLV